MSAESTYRSAVDIGIVECLPWPPPAMPFKSDRRCKEIFLRFSNRLCMAALPIGGGRSWKDEANLNVTVEFGISVITRRHVNTISSILGGLQERATLLVLFLESCPFFEFGWYMMQESFSALSSKCKGHRPISNIIHDGSVVRQARILSFG